MNNLDKIKEAWDIGYSAKIVFCESLWKVVAVLNNSIVILGKDGQARTLIETKHPDWNKQIEITGYLYAGQLADNEPIPKNQKFLIRDEIENAPKDYIAEIEDEFYDNGLIKLKGWDFPFRRDEIEPVFD